MRPLEEEDDDFEEEDDDFEDDGYPPDEPCPTCRGRGTVNPLTCPTDFFCVSTTTCPHCEGSGVLDW